MILIVIGLLSGIISGMGIGGGTLLIPALIIFIGVNQHTGQSINLLYFIPTAAIALVTHMKNRNIRKDLLWKLIVGGIIGAAIGAIIANQMEPSILRKMFGGFLFIMGILEVFKKESKNKKEF